MRTVTRSHCDRLCCRYLNCCQWMRLHCCGSSERNCGEYGDPCGKESCFRYEHLLGEGAPAAQEGSCCTIDMKDPDDDQTNAEEFAPPAMKERCCCCTCRSMHNYKCCGRRPFPCWGFRKEWRAACLKRILTDLELKERSKERIHFFIETLLPVLLLWGSAPALIGVVAYWWQDKSFNSGLWMYGMLLLQIIAQIAMFAYLMVYACLKWIIDVCQSSLFLQTREEAFEQDNNIIGSQITMLQETTTAPPPSPSIIGVHSAVIDPPPQLLYEEDKKDVR